MQKKHMFLRVFSKITIFACVFCTLSAWSDTTTCDIDFTPVTGNSIQNGTPTPTNPVAIESIGTKVGNKYQISVTAQGNLFDKEAKDTTNGFVSSHYITVNNELISFSCNVSEYIQIKPNTDYYLSTRDIVGLASICFYTDNKEFISGVPSNTKKITTPNNAKYVRLSYWIADEDKVMLVEGSIAPASYIPYSAPITTTVYLDEPLRKVGDYADVLDYKNGTITRNVGVKVFDGTENLIVYSDSYIKPDACDVVFLSDYVGDIQYGMCSHLSFADRKAIWQETGQVNKITFNRNVHTQIHMNFANDVLGVVDYTTENSSSVIAKAKSYLAQQYANGTPVIVYYPLATPVVEQIENWSCTPPITDIQIATTKFVDDEFAAAEANLATTVQTIESVVSRTIAQTGQIQVLQDTKQTRPDETCPANMKCLLVQDEDGTPHWYPIIEP